MRNNKGFSLVELIVVIAIMAILAAVAIPTFSGFIKKAQEGSDKDFAAGIQYAVEVALAGEAQKPTAITATIDSNGKIAKLTYVVDGTTYVVLGESENNEVAPKSEIKELIAGSIDTTYTVHAKKDLPVDIVTLDVSE